MRPIDADALFKKLDGLATTSDVYGMGVANGLANAKTAILGAPTIDAVPAVRCEDCVSSVGDRFGELICQNQFCPCYGREVDHAFSCILVERRSDNG